MKKIFLSLLTVFMVLSLSVVLVKADGETSVELNDKISVRTDANVGIMWEATVTNPVEGQTYGFLFAKGEVADLNKDTANVEKVETTELLEGNKFRATMVKFPKAAVAQDISVRTYVKTGEEYTYSEYVDVRNLAETVLYAKNQGLNGDGLSNVVSYLENNYMKTYNVGNTQYLVKPIYEYEPTELAKEFIKDWNSVMGETVTTLSGWGKNYIGAYVDAATASDIQENSLYKFFKTEGVLTKWGWLLNYISDIEKQNENAYVVAQVQYLNGTLELGESNAKWWGARHILGRIENFFTRQSSSDTGFNSTTFTTNNEYPNLISTIEGLTNKIYATVECDYVKVGSSIQLSEQPELSNGYAWDGFKANEELYDAESEYVVTNSVAVFVPTTHAIEYTITYKDGENVINTLEPVTYKVTTSTFNLPKYSKEGYLFKGWYCDPEFTQEATQVAKGTYGDKVFYAKFEAGYVINYNYNGGYLNYGSKADVVADLFADLSTYKGSTVTPTSMACYSSAWSLNNFYKFFQNETYAAKWLWLVELFAEKETVTNVKNGFLYLLGEKSWDNNYAYAIDYVICAFGNNYQYTKNSNYLTYDYSLLEDSTIITSSQPSKVEVTGLGTVTTLPIIKTNQKGYEFAGWFDNETLEGTAITQVSGNATLYAKFALANYSITFNCGEGQSLVALPSNYTMESATIILPTAEQMKIENGTFVGWFTNEECTGTPVTEITKGSVGNIELYAGWLMDTATEVVLSDADKAVLTALEPTIVVSSEFGLGKFDVNGTVYEAGVTAFTTITEALTAAGENAKVYIFAGTYDEALTISNVGLTIYGPNYSVKGYESRNAEANITKLIDITGEGVTVNGLKFTDEANVKVSASKVTIANSIITPSSNIGSAGSNRKGVLVSGVSTTLTGISILNNYLDTPGTTFSISNESIVMDNVKDMAISGNYIINSKANTSGSYGSSSAMIRLYSVSGTLNINNNNFDWGTNGYSIEIANNANTCTEINIKENVFNNNGLYATTAGINIRKGQTTTVTNVVGNEFYNVTGSVILATGDAGSTINIKYNVFGEGTTYKTGGIASATLVFNNNYYALSEQTTSTSDFNTYTHDSAGLAKYEADYAEYLATLE